MEDQERLIAQGMSENEVQGFLMHNLQLIEMDANLKHHHIQKTQEQIRDVETAKGLVGMQAGGRDALDFNRTAGIRKSKLESEIKEMQRQLHQC